jgi:glucose-6-phosphate isomerase
MNVKSITWSYKESCLVASSELDTASKKLQPEIGNVREALKSSYYTDYASINLPSDHATLQEVCAVIDEKKKLNPRVLIVIGIGGSNLGAKAVHEALQGKLYNEISPSLKVYWADTVDSDHIACIAFIIEQELKQNNNVLLNVISKSGTTTETAANFAVLLSIIKKYKKDDFYKYIVAITDKNSKLWDLAHHEKFTCLEVQQKVGGRFSVFSAVGLFPLGMLGINIQELLDGAQSIISPCIDETLEHNPAGLSAALLAIHYKKGKIIHDTFLFSVDFESIGAWYRQLMGESIGKYYNKSGKQVHVGITPTVSIGSTDLHSVGQLYLAGPKDKFTSFISIKKNEHNFIIPPINHLALVDHIQGKSLEKVMHAIIDGVQLSYKKMQLPFISWIIPEKTPYFIGQLLQCKMLEIIYLGYLLEVNPFDQPAVELYKQETREILSHE